MYIQNFGISLARTAFPIPKLGCNILCSYVQNCLEEHKTMYVSVHEIPNQLWFDNIYRIIYL